MPVAVETKLEEYYNIVANNEELKSEERLLNAMLSNLKELRELMIEKEKSFCEEDETLRNSSDTRESLRQRCANLINHLVHYKCIIECLATDTLNMESNIIDDDEYVCLSLTYRQAELSVLKAIKINQQRSELFSTMEDELFSNGLLSDIESKWLSEHEERRRLMTKLFLDQHNFVTDKTKSNLERQQMLLNHRYQFITNLVKLS
jgi:hypothetical protein